MKNNPYIKVFQGNNVSMYDLQATHQGACLITLGGVMMAEEQITDLQQAIEYIKDKNIEVFIVDCRRLKSVADMLVSWLQAIWYPTCAINGVKHQIIIDSENVAGQLIIAKIISKTEDISSHKVKNITTALAEAETLLEEIKMNNLLKKLGF